ncbi:hypothetical protein [Cesiribacter sp. SM1]|uniref:hypothetical protein n=1 Tax=Cesiribacter sp. SM1 TaxID=2861196 RepID=UPI0027151A8F|nr:hypothetical protein [Cesiribacter sp. SM1]
MPPEPKKAARCLKQFQATQIMTEVFITDIPNKLRAKRVSNRLQSENAAWKINFDFNETSLPYPCGHTILRVEGKPIDSDKILAIVIEQGFACEMLADKICAQKG